MNLIVYENVKKLCDEKHITVMALEKAAGIANGTVGKWKWRNAKPLAETLLKVATALGTTVDELMKSI